MPPDSSVRRCLILRPLEAFLDSHGLGAGEIEAEPIGDGHSNVTYLIRRGDERWVLRRPPRPPLPPSAHDVLREYRILSACADSPVRVPTPVVACDDVAVIGAPFYLMTHVPGDVLSTRLPAGLDPDADPPRIADELVSALAEIHALDWRATGLAEMAPSPEHYLDRQVRLFTRLWKHNRTRSCPSSTASPTGSPPRARLQGRHARPRRLPARQHDLRHALAGAPGRRPRLGDGDHRRSAGGRRLPLRDLGDVRRGPRPARAPRHRDRGTDFPHRRDRRALCGDRGAGLAGLAWYEALALWKTAMFLEGSYARLLNGTTDDPFFAGLKTGVPELAERAWRLAQNAGAAHA